MAAHGINWGTWQVKVGLLIFILLFLYFGVLPQKEKITESVNRSKIDIISESLTISELVSTLKQDDPRILNYIRKNHLTPPSTLPYNLDKPDGDTPDPSGNREAVKKLLKNKKNGFFVEAGSHNGESWSSTLGFERFDGWSGLCVEPSPINIPLWKGKHRKAWLADVCLSTVPVPMPVKFFHNSKDSMGSKIGVGGAHYGERGNGWKEFTVPCFPIFSLLAALNVTEVDFFNLDVEGVEMEILRTIPFDDILIRTISIEIHIIAKENDPERLAYNQEFIDFMEKKGYRVGKKGWSDFVFVHSSVEK